MADSTISALPRASSGNTAHIVPIANLSASTTQGLSVQSILMTRILTRDNTPANINNSATTTSIYSVAIAGNLMGTTGIVRNRIYGEYWHDVGATATMNVRIGFSTTTIYQDTTAAIAVSAQSRPFVIDVDLANLGATNSQSLSGTISIGAPTATTGMGDLATTALVVTPINGTAAIDTTSAASLEIYLTHSVASAHVTARKNFGYSELVN